MTHVPSPQEIEQEIEQTRERMSSNIDALEQKLSPRNLKRQAKVALVIGLGSILLLALRARGRRRVARRSAGRRVRRVA